MPRFLRQKEKTNYLLTVKQKLSHAKSIKDSFTYKSRLNIITRKFNRRQYFSTSARVSSVDIFTALGKKVG